jgi:hypothetical protein
MSCVIRITYYHPLDAKAPAIARQQALKASIYLPNTSPIASVTKPLTSQSR